MPEIKNNFTQGKMNKDLDERLIPNGQYRDAMNIEVSTSEGSDVGTVQNIKGNTSASILGNLNESCRCVGSIADEKNNKIYWFVHCSDRDGIIEYNSVTGESFFVLVDLFTHVDVEEPFLKFTGKQITGINIIDDFLFWTDGDTEPKKVNIKRQKARQKLLGGYGGLSFGHHSQLDVQGSQAGQLKEEHLAVIKRKPLHAPLVTTTSSVGDPGKSIFKNIFPRFCYRYKYQDGEYSAFSPFTDVVFNPGYISVPGEDGSYNSTTAFSTKEPYNTAMLNYISSVKISGFNRLDTPKDVVQVDILYKQENSNVIYSVASIKTTDPEWNLEGNHQLSGLGLTSFDGYDATVRGSYNMTTENINAALPEDQLLRPWDNVPKKALAQDVSGNRIVYGNYTQGYNIHSTPKLNSSITVRPTHGDTTNPARSLKSLRDYQVGVIFGDKYGRETPVFTSDEGSTRSPWIYNITENQYGASIPLGLESSITSGVPDWADYFKYYVKHTSGEYYNLVMDRAYMPQTTSEVDNEDTHVWLSFASTDRNKLTEDDYIIMKKSLGEDHQVVQENKYKILDIKNEAPAAIAYKFYSMGIFGNDATAILANEIFTSDPSLGLGLNQRIDRETDVVHISKTNWLTSVNNDSAVGDGAPLTSTEETGDHAEEVKDLYMSWSVGATESQKYKISSVRISNGNVYVCKLAKTITAPDADLAAIPGSPDQHNLDHDLIFRIERREIWSNENFSGKFFVKIAADDLVADQIISDTIDITQSANVVATGQTFFWADRPSSSNEANGIVNSQNEGAIVGSYNGGDYDTPADIHSGGTLTNSEVEWAALLAGTSGSGLVGNGNSSGQFGVFIDAMYFAGGNANADAGLSSLARESGQTILGNDTLNYPKMTWGMMGAISAGGGVTYAQDYGWRIPTQGSWEGTPTTNQFGEYSTYPFTWTNTGSGRATISDATIGNADAQVNGLEGIITAAGPEVAGSAEGFRRFVEGSIYQDSRVSNIYGDIYTAAGRHYMFISFAEPGIDLHDGSIPTSVEIGGFDGIAGYLQGIWGGGSFTNPDGSNFGDSDKWSIKMEDHLFTETTDYGINISEGAPTAPGPNVTMTRLEAAEIISNTYNSGTTGTTWENTICSETLGYDGDYQTAHDKQWDVAYGAYADAQVAINNFKAKLAVNNKFRFAGDDSGEVYKILEVNKKHLYNHTTWRAGYRWDGSDWSLKGDSVEEAVVAWANYADADGQVNNTSGASQTAFETMKTRIENFGKQNNRRVCYIIRLDKDPRIQSYNPIAGSSSEPDIDTSTNIEFITPNATLLSSEITKSPMIWETEPSQATDLDIYYEASSAIPTRLTEENVELFMPRGSRVVFPNLPEAHLSCPAAYVRRHNTPTQFETRRENGSTTSCFNYFHPTTGAEINYVGQEIRFYREDGSYTTGIVGEHFPHSTYYQALGDNGTRLVFQIEPEVDASKNTGLSWYNCFTLRNGIESDRIRDGFNEMTITNGARVSATLEEPYAEEHRKSGLIYSGIYNSNSGVNNLNQFIQALKITKDLNPTYGSIQKLFSRSTDLVALCEDRVIKILANKDAVYNADGNPQLVASANVLGQATPFVGDFGISTNPESFASESYRAYFTDASRGAVLRLSMDGLTPISDSGMHDYFRDNLIDPFALYLGSYDGYKKQYNLTIRDSISDNIIQNAFIDTGIDLVEEIPGVNIVLNSDINGGSDYTPVDIDNDIWDGGYGLPYSTARASFNHTTTIRNHPAIGVGDVQQFFEGVPALADVPAVAVPAWAEVIHNAPEGWTTSNALTPDGTPSQNLTYGAEQIYGVANPGSIVTEDGVSYYSGTNNALTVYDQYPGSAVNGEEYTEVVQDVEWNESDILLDYAVSGAGNATSSYIRMDIADDPYIEGNWYLVDVYYDPDNAINAEGDLSALYCPGVLGNSPDIHDARMVSADHNSGHAGYPDFHYGFVNGGSTVASVKHMALMPTVRTEYGTSDLNVLRAIFQYKANENGELYHPNEFRLHAWGFKGVIKSVYRLDITQSPEMTEPDNWNTTNSNFESPHAFTEFITENTVYNASPEVYYKGGMLCWNTDVGSDRYWNQSRTNDPLPSTPSNDGYKFEFTVENNPDTGTVEGSIWGRVSNQIGDFEPGEMAGAIVSNIDTAGDYSILMNFDDSTPAILEKPDGSAVIAQSIHESSLVSPENSGHSNKITFYTHEGFTGALDNITLTDTTNYFTGGTVDSWTFSGFDTGLENWIAWDSLNQRISFNDAPGWSSTQSNQRVLQHLPNFEPQIGDSYLIEFDYYITSGSISGYYYSSTTDQGFNLPGNLSSIDENGNDLGVLRYSAVHTIGDDQPGDYNQLNALTFYIAGGPANGWVDNFVMQQAVSPSVDITTVSFSEDVKGWTSFKSFIPDSGVSVSNNYYTMKKGGLWKHYDNEIRNSFYNLAGESKSSSINVILNQSPSSVKSFKTLNYEGSQSMVPQFVTGANGISNRRIDNITGKQGWEVESVTTDLQKGSINEFIKKEGKWFNYIKGSSDTLLPLGSLNEDMYNSQIANISFQGLGIVSQVFINSSATETTIAE